MNVVADQVEAIREELAAEPSERLLRYLVSDAACKAHTAAAMAKWEEVELWAKLTTDCAGMLQAEK